MADNVLSNVLGEDYQEVNAVNSGNAVYKNGKLQYFKIDVDQPGKYFFNLTDAFNASVDEANKIIPIQFVRGGGYLPLNGFNVSMDGAYPNGTTKFHIVGETQGANPAFINFNMPLGMFQAVGTYRFQFTITNTSTGETLKSPFQFFDVSQTATNLAVDMVNGIEPYDSEYTKWKSKVEQQINSLAEELTNLTTAADQLKNLMNQYVANAEGYVQTEFSKYLGNENTWTGRQHFNGGITFSENAQGDNLVVNTIGTGDLTATGTVTLPNTTSFGDFKANQILNAVLVPGFSGMLMNATKNANDQGQWNKNWWLWASKVNIGVGVDYPCYIMHFDLNLDTSDVGKPIATFNSSAFASSNNAGSTQAVYMNGTGGTMTYHVDSTGVLYLDSVSGISGKGRVRFTGLF